MTLRRFFSEGDLLKALTDVGSHMIEDVRVYLIGGCAMTFIGRKAATKDVDVVLTSSPQVEMFIQAAKQAGFRRVDDASLEYESLGVWNIVENEEGMRFDVFDRQVCRCLTIDAGMESRARLFHQSRLNIVPDVEVHTSHPSHHYRHYIVSILEILL